MHDHITYRPVPFYFLNTTDPQFYTADYVNQAVRRLKENGFGGLVIFNKPPTGFDHNGYLSDFWYEINERFAEACLQEGLELWLNDGYNFPPGDAGGRIEAADPSLYQRRLHKGPDGRPEVVKVDWGFPAFEEPETSFLFHKIVYDEYARRLGRYFGKSIVGIFSDADNRRYNAGTRRPMGAENYFPWARNFPERFQQRFGYDLTPYLGQLLDGVANAQTADYWRFCGELYQQWFANNRQWCHEHGLLYSFHTSDTGPFTRDVCQRSSIYIEGAPLELLHHSDLPGTDHELFALDGGRHFDNRYFTPKVSYGSGTERYATPNFNMTKYDLRAKYAASAAVLAGQSRVLCEAFAATNWGATHADIRRIAAWQLMQGINFFIPHAVHHTFFGPVKHFAPPEFLSGSLRHGLHEFTDWLSHLCFVASQGKYIPDIAVIDPTPDIWAGKTDGKHIFDLCDKLNRLPCNYIICSREQAARFPRSLDVSEAAAFDFSSLDNGIRFTGPDCAYMRRTLDDGTEYLLIANIWSDQTVNGNLTFNGKSYALELCPGEIAVIGGPWENYRSPSNYAHSMKLASAMPVKWLKQNIAPVLKPISWTNQTAVSDLRLLVPAVAVKTTDVNWQPVITRTDSVTNVQIDGIPLSDGTPCRMFGDDYTSFPLPSSSGSHSLTFTGTPSPSEPLYFVGDFNVKAITTGDFHEIAFSFYDLQVHYPENVRLEFSAPRTSSLLPGDWSAQGHPFYSGGVEYTLTLNGQAQNAVLEFPQVNGVLVIDGQTLIWPPFTYPVGNLDGSRTLRFTVYNTYANQIEMYRAPSGLLQPPVLHWN